MSVHEEDSGADTGTFPLVAKHADKLKSKHVRLEISPPQKGRALSELTLPQSDTQSAGGDPERAAWGGKLEFIFTCIGYAVGLGNVWRFPYLCYSNGGGAFLVPYVIMLAVVGLPLFFMELSFGQYASLGPLAIWKINPLFKGLGYAMVSASWLIAIYYNVIIAHVMMFLFASFRAVISGLPWVSCDNSWNTDACINQIYVNSSATDLIDDNSTDVGVLITTVATNIAKTAHNYSEDMKTPAEEYYNNYILEMSSGIDEMGPVNWKLALCLLLAWTIVLICLIRGIQSLGKVVYFTALFPYVMLTILLIRGLTLPGAWLGIKFYLTPDFNRLLDSRVWCDAATQIFYSLGACNGGLIAMSSYNKFNNNCLRDSLIVSMINCATSIYAGFVIFSILGFMALEKNLPVSEVAAGGPGLAFVVYPEAISRMPVPVMWAIFFFFMMATLGFGSQFSMVECVLSAFTDEFPSLLQGQRQSIIFRTAVILLTFLLGLPMVTSGGIYLLNLVDYSVSGFPLLVIGFLELVALNWIYGFARFSEDIYLMLGRRLNLYWKACWMVISPLVIAATIIFNMVYYKAPTMSGVPYPHWAQVMGWLITLFPMALIVGFFLLVFCRKGGFKLMRQNMEPTADWGPASQAKESEIYDTEIPLTPKEFEGTHFTFDGYEYRKVLCSNCAEAPVQIRVGLDHEEGEEEECDLSEHLKGVSSGSDDAIEAPPGNSTIVPEINLEMPPDKRKNSKISIKELRNKFFASPKKDKVRTESETSHTESDDAARNVELAQVEV